MNEITISKSTGKNYGEMKTTIRINGVAVNVQTLEADQEEKDLIYITLRAKTYYTQQE